MSESSTPAGWYPDPSTPGQQRYWDGSAWTDATQPAAPTAPPPPPTGGYAPPSPPGYGAVPGAAYGQPIAQMGYGYVQGGPQPADFFSRLGALIIDALIVGIPIGIVVSILLAINDVVGIIGYVAGIAAGLYYWGYFEGGPEGQTIGKRTLSIRTVDATTLQPGIGMGRAIGRQFARILSGFLCYLGYLWMLWDPEKQTWHDKIVSTKVVKV